jgi:hypothetical protein
LNGRSLSYYLSSVSCFVGSARVCCSSRFVGNKRKVLDGGLFFTGWY